MLLGTLDKFKDGIINAYNIRYERLSESAQKLVNDFFKKATERRRAKRKAIERVTINGVEYYIPPAELYAEHYEFKESDFLQASDIAEYSNEAIKEVYDFFQDELKLHSSDPFPCWLYDINITHFLELLKSRL